jgi:SAM-dependent methyltransferase
MVCFLGLILFVGQLFCGGGRMLGFIRSRINNGQKFQSHSIADYQALVRRRLKVTPHDRALALAQAIGAETMVDFAAQGDGHAAVLRHHGLTNGMSVYDLGCGCGRTAQALQRSGWLGNYIGADVVPELLEELTRQCPDYSAVLNKTYTIAAPDASLDMVFHWSVFTHLYPGEAYLYTADAFRALKPGGRMVFSFLELEDAGHDRVWESNLARLRRGERAEQLDTFLHRDSIRRFARDAGFLEPHFTNGSDDTHHPQFWQALAAMEKPS